MNEFDKSRPVLLTGSEGAIGRVVSPKLRAAGFLVREFDHKPDAEHAPDVEGNIQADMADPDVLDRAAQGVGAIIHLAAFPNAADFLDVLLRPNVVGLYRVLEAARKNKVDKLILASSVQTVNDAYPKDGQDDERPIPVTTSKPTNHYGLTKIWAEAAGEMYSRLHDLPVLAARIGWFPRNAGEVAAIGDGSEGGEKVYLSHDDAGRFFVDALEASWTGFHVVYAVSRAADGRPRFDPEPARRLIGFEPRDAFPVGSSW